MNDFEDEKVVVIGLDGGTFDLVKPWVGEGRLPVISRLMKEGAHSALASTVPAFSPPAWTSFMTGKNPGKHGIFDFTRREGNSYRIRFVNRSLLSGKTLWRILSDGQKRVGIVSVPITYPPEAVNGFLLAGLQTPSTDANFTYPPELKIEILDTFGEYLIDMRHTHDSDLDSYLVQLERLVENRAAVAEYLLNHYPVDFFMCVFVATDRVSHFYWKYMDSTHPLHNPDEAERYGDSILRIYQGIDEKIGTLIERLDDDATVFIVSDHGFGPLYKHVDLNSWLRSEGFLRYKSAQRGQVLGEVGFQAMAWAVKTLRAAIPISRQQELKRRTPKLRHAMASYLGLSNVDWRHTQAFSVGHDCVYINLKGREPHGVVEPSEYEDVRDLIIEQLRRMRDPENGVKIVGAVYRREELYDGPYVPSLPDLVIVWKDHPYATRQRYGERNKDWVLPPGKTEGMPFAYSGTHRPEGILIAKGKHIRRVAEIEGASIIDLAPTILYLMGLPVPEDVDGKVLTGLFTEEFLTKNPIRFCEAGEHEEQEQGFSEEETKQIEQRLRSLGYL